MSALRLDRVSKHWGTSKAVDEASFATASGRLVVLLGPSGCGKSTTLRMIAGLDAPTTGRVWIGERDVTDLGPAQRRISMVFQSYALFPHLNVRENILFGVKVRGEPAAEHGRRLARVADLLGLTPLLDRKPSQLSGGQQQRVALGRAIIAETPVCLMDEPLSNLDAQLRLQTRTELKQLHHDLGTTMIYVTHDQSEAMTLGGRVAIMQRGAVVQAGAPLELYRAPVNTFVATFLGSPPMNLLTPIAGAANGARITIGVRPEDVDVALSPASDRVEAQVSVVEPMGSETLVTLEYRAQRLVARVPADRVFEPGQRAFVRFATERTLRFDETGARVR